MKHFAVYHHPERMGYSADEVGELCIVTNKSVDNLIGNRIWLIQGEGKPRKYTLRGTFIADSTCSDTEDGFRHLRDINSTDPFGYMPTKGAAIPNSPDFQDAREFEFKVRFDF